MESPEVLEALATGYRVSSNGTLSRCEAPVFGSKKGNYRAFRVTIGCNTSRLVRLHRAVFFLTNGWMPVCVDHIDGDTTNNHPLNLRGANKQENSWNSSRYKRRDMSVPRGVTQVGVRFAVVMSDGAKRKVYLGTFNTKEEAGSVADAWRKDKHGAFYRPDPRVKGLNDGT